MVERVAWFCRSGACRDGLGHRQSVRDIPVPDIVSVPAAVDARPRCDGVAVRGAEAASCGDSARTAPGIAGRLRARLHDADAAGGRREARVAGVERPPLQRRRMEGVARACVRGCVVSAQRALSAGAGRRVADRSEDARAHSFHGPAMDGRRRAEQLPRTQSRCTEIDPRDAGRKPAAGDDEPARRPAARQDFADRRIAVRGRQEPRVYRGRGRVRERPDPADPVHAEDGQGVRAAAADRAAVHQQVLHPRPATREFARRARAVERPSGVPRVVAQRGCVGRAQDVGRLHERRAARGDRRGAADQRPRADQHARLLRRRHDARDRARGARRPRRTSGCVDDIAHRDARFHRHGHPRRVRRRSARADARADHRRQERYATGG